MSPYKVQRTEFCPVILPTVDTVNTDTVLDWKGFFQDKCILSTANNAQLNHQSECSEFACAITCCAYNRKYFTAITLKCVDEEMQ